MIMKIHQFQVADASDCQVMIVEQLDRFMIRWSSVVRMVKGGVLELLLKPTCFLPSILAG